MIRGIFCNPARMNTPTRIASLFLVLLLLGFAALHTGLARQAFFWLANSDSQETREQLTQLLTARQD